MALVGWMLSFMTLFAALALRQDMPVDGSAILSNMLALLSLLACPLIWRDKPFGISRGPRIVTALVLLFSLPLLLTPGA